MDRYGVQRLSERSKSDQTVFTFKFPVLSFKESIRVAIGIRASAHHSKRIKPEDARLMNSLYLLADKDAEAGIFKLIAKGVEVYSAPQQIGSSRGVVVATAEGLIFDASTLKVVQEERFEELLRQIREQMELLRNEVLIRRGVVPKTFQLGPGSL